ncbi:MAG: hypothetical protein KF893_22145 [Caldilineaceae bacterium]|nr:hypothetical protein [Caldilineaceae bacterium]
MQIDGYEVITVDERPPLAEAIDAMIVEVWPAYMIQSSTRGYSDFNPDWYGIFRRWPRFQLGLFDAAGEMVACGNGLSFAWDGDPDSLLDTGWDWVMHQGAVDFEEGRTPNTFVALSASIPQIHQGKGLSATILRAMRQLALDAGLQRMVVPVRPNFKARYPLIPIDDYITWTDRAGLPFDPWMRVHARLGARILKSCPRAMTMGGRVARWEEWTGVAIPGSGEFVLPELLAPLHVDHPADRCVYVEPNVWMEHRIAGSG